MLIHLFLVMMTKVTIVKLDKTKKKHLSDSLERMCVAASSGKNITLATNLMWY